MDYKWIGAVLIIAGCGGFGFTLAALHRREEGTLRSIMRALDFMTSELHFHGTPLPELCRGVAEVCENAVGQVFFRLAEELEACQCPRVSVCMDAVLDEMSLPEITRQVLHQLGTSLGRFDLEGQMKGLEESRDMCRRQLEALAENRDSRLRNYQTLSLCTGAALAILLI